MKNIIFEPHDKPRYHKEPGSRRSRTIRSTLVFVSALLGYLLITAASLLLAGQLPGKGMQALLVQVMIGIWVPVAGFLPFSIWCLRRGWKASAAGVFGGMVLLGLTLVIGAAAIQEGFRL